MYEDRIKRGFSHDDIMQSIHHIGRDNARTPMQWEDTTYGGFSEVTPWIGVNKNYKEINAKSQMSDDRSVFNYYKQLIFFRRNSQFKDLIRKGNFELIEKENKDVFAYQRKFEQQVLNVVCNFRPYEVAFKFDNSNILLSNYSQTETCVSLRPYEAIVYVS